MHLLLYFVSIVSIVTEINTHTVLYAEINMLKAWTLCCCVFIIISIDSVIIIDIIIIEIKLSFIYSFIHSLLLKPTRFFVCLFVSPISLYIVKNHE